MDFHEVVADVDAECRKERIPMLGREKAERLVEWIREQRPQLIVEIGTAVGYSGLWIADTLRRLGQGRLVTLELESERAARAKRSFERAGVDSLITQVVGDAREEVGKVQGPIDLLFLDGGFPNYYPCLMNCIGQLRDGALLVADNAGIGAAEMADYLDFVRKHFESRTEWFETDLAWNPRDAMEISRYRAGSWSPPAAAP
jgi:predicted O-methyltransferase YrrM